MGRAASKLESGAELLHSLIPIHHHHRKIQEVIIVSTTEPLRPEEVQHADDAAAGSMQGSPQEAAATGKAQGVDATFEEVEEKVAVKEVDAEKNKVAVETDKKKKKAEEEEEMAVAEAAAATKEEKHGMEEEEEKNKEKVGLDDEEKGRGLHSITEDVQSLGSPSFRYYFNGSVPTPTSEDRSITFFGSEPVKKETAEGGFGEMKEKETNMHGPEDSSHKSLKWSEVKATQDSESRQVKGKRGNKLRALTKATGAVRHFLSVLNCYNHAFAVVHPGSPLPAVVKAGPLEQEDP